MRSMFWRKLFVLFFDFRHAYSTLIPPHSQNLFSHFASTRFNISQYHITRMCKWFPHLQRLQTLEKVEQYIDLLKRCGCSEVQIAKIMIQQPNVMGTSVERILEPKIKLLEDFGFHEETLTKLLVSNPRLLSSSLEKELLPKMEFFKNQFQSQQFFVKFLPKSPFILSSSLEKTLKPSIVFWERYGFKGTELLRLIRINSSVLLCTSLTADQADLIHEIGANRKSSAYKYIVSYVVVSRLETLKAKIENLKLCGLSVEETWQLCRARPQVLQYSKAKVSELMNFVVKDMELPANYIVRHGDLFTKNVEKIIRPRFLVWQKIKSTDGPRHSLYALLMMPEARFIRNIIKAHPESTTLWTMYENAISSASRHTKSSIQS